MEYAWDDPGTQVITVTAINDTGSSTDTFSLPMRMLPASLGITGPTTGEVQSSYTFSATVSPITTTIPITYVWLVDDQMVLTHQAGVVDIGTFSWDLPGTHHLSVSATNAAGSVEASWTIDIHVKIYFPITLRH
jgi:hypothetical protein